MKDSLGFKKNMAYHILFLCIVLIGINQVFHKKQGQENTGAADGRLESRHSYSYSDILGAGASFPFPLYAKMFEAYRSEHKVRVNYQSIGSGGGVRQIRVQTIDFGATDAHLDDKQIALFKSEGKEILHIPIVLGAVVVAYNLKGFKNLKLNGAVLAGIYSGAIKKWDDEKIQSLNSNRNGESLPNKNIIAVHRSDGSGTTFVFSDFLGFSSDSWKRNVGIGKSLKWFRGALGAKGNEGVTQQIKNIPGAIGYISLNYALSAKLPIAAIQNADGKYILPSIKSVSEAASGQLPSDARVRLSGTATGGKGYPLSTFTWILVYKQQAYKGRSVKQAKELKNMLAWMLQADGQSLASPLFYAPLPKKAALQAKSILSRMLFNRQNL